MTDLVTGLDLGGAHLKLAQVEPSGRCVHARQVPCQLWRGLDRLDEAMALLTTTAAAPLGAIALTMTGELADLFSDRASGVLQLLERIEARLPNILLFVYAGRHGLLRPGEIRRAPLLAASMNWLASAEALAQLLPEALFVDIGSTTTDILALRAGGVATEASSDADRLASGELVYTGLTRTPLMALATQAPVAGRWSGVMAEHFATTADVWRILGLLAEDADQHPAADGGEKTTIASVRRLARMVGRDAEELPMADWRQLARFFGDRQLASIERGVEQVLAAQPLAPAAPYLGAGAGSALVAALARRQDRPYRPASSMLEAGPGLDQPVATCFPAVAVARLLAIRMA